MTRYDLSKTYKFQGLWWIGGTSAKFPGQLILSPDEIKLRVYGNSSDLAPLDDYDSEKNKLPIFGKSDNGTLFTLWSASSLGLSHSSQRIASVEREWHAVAIILANYCFIGKHIDSPNDKVDADCYINFPHLEAWFGQPFHETKSMANNQKGVLISLDIKDLGNLINVELPSMKVKLKSHHAVQFNGGEEFKQYNSDCTAYLIFQAGHDISPDNVMNFAYNVTNLWSLFTGVHIAPQEVFFRKINEQLRNWDEVRIYSPLKEYGAFDRIYHHRDILLKYEILKNSIGNIVDKWLSEGDQMSAVKSLFFNAYRSRRKRVYTVSQFLNYVTILEIIGRRDDKPEKHLSKNDAKALRDKLEKVINEFMPETDQRARIVKKLDYIHVPTLRESIEKIADGLMPQTKKQFSLLDTAMIQKLVHSRNYYTHYGDVNRGNVISLDDLPSAINQLTIITSLLLLKKLGINEELIMDGFKNRWDYKSALRN
ncbi:MAG: hypothetical protein NPIRA01_11420 [Nitrospirales bacterium]|nr:MAG: hypothetical protein NPIRA01_11420 [Nitrospirales bacterium]